MLTAKQHDAKRTRIYLAIIAVAVAATGGFIYWQRPAPVALGPLPDPLAVDGTTGNAASASAQPLGNPQDDLQLIQSEQFQMLQETVVDVLPEEGRTNNPFNVPAR